MLKCSGCGKEYMEGVFCPECGQKLEEIVVENNVSSNEQTNETCFCPNCGSKINANAVFCPNCGYNKNGSNNQNAYNQKINTNKGFDIKKLLFIGVPIIIIIFIAFFLFKFILGLGGGALGKDQDAIINGLNNSIKAVLDKDSVKYVNEVMKNGSVEIKTDLANIRYNGRSPIGMFLNGQINAKMYLQNDKCALTADGDVMGIKFNDNISYLSNDKFIIKVPFLFGDTVYGFSLKDIKNDLGDSWLRDRMGEDWYNTLKNQVENETKINKNEFVRDVEKVFLGFENETKNVLAKNLKFENENTNIEINNENVNVLKVSTNVNYKQTKDIATALLNYAKTNEDIKKVINKYSSYIVSLHQFKYYFYDVTADELYDRYVIEIDNIINYLENSDGDNYSDNTKDVMYFTFYISKSSKQLIGFEAKLDDEGAGVIVTVGPDITNYKFVSVNFKNDYENDNKYVFTKDDSGNVVTYNVFFNDRNMLNISWDKDTGKLNLNDYEDRYIYANLKYGKTTTFDVGIIELQGDTIEPATEIIIKNKDSFPSIPNKYENILKLTESDINRLTNNITEKIMGSMGY